MIRPLARPAQLELSSRLQAQGTWVADPVFAQDEVHLYANSDGGLQSFGPNGDQTTLCAAMGGVGVRQRS